MRAKLLLMPLGLALLCLTACDIEDFGSFQRFQRDFHYSYPLKSGGSFSVEGFNGTVDISGWDQDSVDISGTKYGPTQEAADALQIDIRNTPDEVSIRAVRPSDRRNNEGARFTIKIPRTAVLDRITTSNGSIHTMDGKGPARLKTSNGAIRVQNLAGSVDATTSNAPVELENVAGDATVHSSNGHIHTERLGGSLEASTSNASITATVGESNPAAAFCERRTRQFEQRPRHAASARSAQRPPDCAHQQLLDRIGLRNPDAGRLQQKRGRRHARQRRSADRPRHFERQHPAAQDVGAGSQTPAARGLAGQEERARKPAGATELECPEILEPFAVGHVGILRFPFSQLEQVFL
jgi:hypothetical protein